MRPNATSADPSPRFLRGARRVAVALGIAAIGLPVVALAGEGTTTMRWSRHLDLRKLQDAVDKYAVVQFEDEAYDFSGQGTLVVSKGSVLLRSVDGTGARLSLDGIEVELLGQGEQLEVGGTPSAGGRDVSIEGLVLDTVAGVYVHACHDFAMVGSTVETLPFPLATADAVTFGDRAPAVCEDEAGCFFIDGTVVVSGSSLNGFVGLASNVGFVRIPGDPDTLSSSVKVSANFLITDNDITGFAYGISIIGQMLAPYWLPDEPSFYNGGNFTIVNNDIRGLYGIWCTALGGDLDASGNAIATMGWADNNLGSSGAFFSRNGPDSQIVFDHNHVWNNSYDAALGRTTVFGVGVGVFGPTSNVHITDNEFAGHVQYAAIFSGYYPYELPPSETSDCTFSGNHAADLIVEEGLFLAAYNAHHNDFVVRAEDIEDLDARDRLVVMSDTSFDNHTKFLDIGRDQVCFVSEEGDVPSDVDWVIEDRGQENEFEFE